MHEWKRKAKLKRWRNSVCPKWVQSQPIVYCMEFCSTCRYFAYPLCVRLGLPKQFQYCKYIHDRHLKKGEDHITKFFRSGSNGCKTTILDGRTPRDAQETNS